MSDKLKNFIVRTASGAVLLAVVVGASYFGVISYSALLLLIAIVGVWEFYNLAEAKAFSKGTGTVIFAVPPVALPMIKMSDKKLSVIENAVKKFVGEVNVKIEGIGKKQDEEWEL